MRNRDIFKIKDLELFLEKLLIWQKKFSHSCILVSNYNEDLPLDYHNYDIICAVDIIDQCVLNNNSFSGLKDWYNSHKDWVFGHLSYDIKNEIEGLSCNKKNYFQASNLHFFRPKYILTLSKKGLVFESYESSKKMREIIDLVHSLDSKNKYKYSKIKLKSRESKQDYLRKIKNIKEHIQKGDIYELNYCSEFFNNKAIINPERVFIDLNKKSRAPFSVFLKINKKYVLSASPERFLRKKGNNILSQPIKGTRRRSLNSVEDIKLMNNLVNSKKDISENVMTVDLVRNDLSKTAEKGSVGLEDLCGVYTFKQVHQMITTISSKLDKTIHFIDMIETMFPMGSMTGVPKMRAMELIEYYEKSRRSVFSGSIGYISPKEDFDFNVVIRSILYNAEEKYLSVSAGGAITIRSTPEQEYEECILKAEALFTVLGQK